MITIKNTKQSARELARAILESGVFPQFDLDGVLLNASHRQACNPDGSLNLDDYRAKSTPENIALDKEMALIETIAILNVHRIPYNVITARVACDGTLARLDKAGIRPNKILARNGEHDTRRDYQLKTDHLVGNYSRRERENMLIIDDNLANCKALVDIGLKAIHVPFGGH